jgi:GR25 family glycosyltransferase involved in LPS biosynthesis
MGDRVGLNMIRISAFDGTSYSTTANKVEQAMMVSYDNFEISESDVASTWNTTLNSKFDSGCTADLAVSLTSSEKACAASHLHVWRIIDQLRTQGGTVPEVSQWFKFHDFVRSNLALSKQLSSKESVVKIADDDMDCYLILEDDADCKSYVEINFRSELLSMVKKAALSDWDIIYLGGVTPTKSSLFQGIPLKGGYFTKVNYIWMLHAYLIKGSSITNKLLKCLPIVGPVDNFLATLIYNGTLTAYALGDFIVDQSAGRMSDRLKDSNVVRSGVSASTTVRGYRNILDKRKLSESHEHQDPIDVKRLKDDKLTK